MGMDLAWFKSAEARKNTHHWGVWTDHAGVNARLHSTVLLSSVRLLCSQQTERAYHAVKESRLYKIKRKISTPT
jgi:hypothetical protein